MWALSGSTPQSLNGGNSPNVPIACWLRSRHSQRNELTTDKATDCGGKKLEAGNVFWVPANEMVNVVSGQGEPAKFVLVEFQ